MTYNQKAIQEHWEQYKKAYEEKFRETPKSWFGYQQWLASKNLAYTFTQEDTEYTKSVMGVN